MGAFQTGVQIQDKVELIDFITRNIKLWIFSFSLIVKDCLFVPKEKFQLNTFYSDCNHAHLTFHHPPAATIQSDVCENLINSAPIQWEHFVTAKRKKEGEELPGRRRHK